MERKEQFLKIVEPLAPNESTALKYTQHLEELFDVIIPEKIGKEFCDALRGNNYLTAVNACAEHFRSKPDFTVPGLSARGWYSIEAADNCIKGISRSVNVDWTFPDGEIDFLFNPTELNGPVNHEWLWQFNRHNEWSNMARAYIATGDEKYAKAFSSQLLKWIAQTDIPEKWNGPGSAWRTIECGIRLLGSWPVTFDGFKKSPTLSDTALLLMIASMHRQSTHLIEHPTSKNWLMMESNGVYTFSSLFTELIDSERNKKTASDYLLAELESQILPDGMHNELSPDYQSVVLNCATNFYSLALDLGAADEIPEAFTELMRNTVNAAILLSTPAFTQPRTNDTYTIKTSIFTSRAERLLGSRPEYLFVNSNRKDGAPPRGETASALLPYAGLAVMRSDWGPDATYMCFDVGPLGMAHIHQDKLNINVFKGSRELIYDDGGGQYDLSAFRKYAVSGYAHNTVLVDGLAQNRKEPKCYEAPVDIGWITNGVFDYATATYDDTFGEDFVKPATHTREIRFCKPDLFCVSDTLSSSDGRAHDYEVLFHLDTTRIKELEEYKNGIISDFGNEYDIVIIPLDGDNASVELKTYSAVTDPQLQGWYNGRNEATLHEAITVSRRVTGVKDYRFNTFLIPIKAGGNLPAVTKEANGEVRISLDGKEYKIDLSALNC